MDFDKLILNSRIYPLVNEGEWFEAMALKDGRIAKLFEKEPGNANQIADEVIDVKGKTIIPGLIDSHFHFMASAALNEVALNVSEINTTKNRVEPHTLDGFRLKLQEFAKTQDPKLPILCFNYIIAAMDEDRLPFAKELDKWVPNRYVIVTSMDGHSSAHSSKSLKYMGFDPHSHNGILTGEDHEFNLGKINNLVLESLTPSIIFNSIQNLINDAAHHGITMIHCLDGFDDLENDKSLWFLTKFGRFLPIELRVFPQFLSPKKVEPYVKYMAYKRLGGCGAWEQDGSVGSQTAAFQESYANKENDNGKVYYTYDQMDKFVKNAHSAGYQITSHAIGPRAIDVILHAFQGVIQEDKKIMGKTNRFRHRIDHFEFPTKEQVDLAIDELNLVITAQPGYSWMDEAFQKAYRRYLTPHQYQSQIPLKNIYEKGGILCGSSDSPVQHLNPFVQLEGLVNFPLENEQLSMFQALRSYTYNGAYSVFEEKLRGTLEPGKIADFIILDKDPFKISKTDILDLKVLDTYTKGERFEDWDYGMFKFMGKYLFSKKHKI